MYDKLITTISKRSDFIYLRKHGKKVRSNLLNIIYVKYLIENQRNLNSKSIQSIKIAYVASKKVVGNAVKRNRSKRRLRSLIREYCSIIPNNYLLLLISSSRAYDVDYSLLKSNFLYCLNKIRIESTLKGA